MSCRLVIEDLTVSYRRVPAVHHLSATLAAPSCVGLLGPNGAGKTTLLKTIAGLLPIETGGIKFVDGGRTLKDHPRLIAYVPQREAVDWDFPITVRTLAEMGRYPALGWWRSLTEEDCLIVDEALEIADLTSVAHRQIRALSGGQQQRAFLARAWAQQASVYLLDEPFTGLDRNAQEAFFAAIRRLREAGKLVIASHHDLKSVPDLFDQVVIINGELVAAGPTSEVFRPETIEEAFGTRIFSGHESPPHHHHHHHHKHS